MYSSDTNTHFADLAYHFYEAGSWAKALDYSQRAGRQAQDLYAPRTAIEHFSRAIESAQHLPSAASPDVYRARGQAYEIIGDFESAIDDHEAALEIGRASSNERAIWQSLMDLGMAWASREYTRAGDYLQEALELARKIDDAAILAYSLNRMANWLTNRERAVESITLHKEALQIFEEINDEKGMAITLDTLGTTYASLVNIEQALSHYRRAASLFRALDDRLGLTSTLTMLTLCGTQYMSSVSRWAGQSLEQCLADGEEALVLAQATSWRSGEALACINLGFALSTPGEYGRALQYAETGLQIAAEIEHLHWQTLAHILLGAIYLDLFSLSRAREHLEEALTFSSHTGSDYWGLTTLGFLVPTCILQNDVQRAETVLASFSAKTPMQTVGQRQAWYACAELYLAQADATGALKTIDQMIASIPSSSDHSQYSVPRLTRLRGAALAKLEKKEEARTFLELGLQNAMSQGVQSFIWRFHLDRWKASSRTTSLRRGRSSLDCGAHPNPKIGYYHS